MSAQDSMIGIFCFKLMHCCNGIDGHGWDAVEDPVKNCTYYLPKVKLTLSSTTDPSLNSPLKIQR